MVMSCTEQHFSSQKTKFSSVLVYSPSFSDFSVKLSFGNNVYVLKTNFHPLIQIKQYSFYEKIYVSFIYY